MAALPLPKPLRLVRLVATARSEQEAVLLSVGKVTASAITQASKVTAATDAGAAAEEDTGAEVGPDAIDEAAAWVTLAADAFRISYWVG